MRDARREDGQMLPLLVVALLGIVAMGALVVAIGRASIVRSEAQTAADAAALAGARNVRDQLVAMVAATGTADVTAIDRGAVEQAARHYAEANHARLSRPIEIDGADVKAWVVSDNDAGPAIKGDTRGEARARARVVLGGGPTGVSDFPTAPSGGGGGGGGGAFKPFTAKDWAKVAKQLKHHPPQCTDDPNTNDVVILGRMLQAHGATILANAAFGDPPVASEHVPGSWHMRCDGMGALDVNFDSTGREPQILDSIVGEVRKLGFFTIWRAPGHYNHMHVDASGGGGIGAGSDLGGATGGSLGDALLEVQLVDWDAPSPVGFGAGFLTDPGGIPFGPPDPKVASVACQVLDDLHASPKARIALWEALIVESGVKDLPWGDSTSVGPLQELDIWGSVAHRMDVHWAISYFLQYGFWNYGGAMALARDNPGASPGWVAQMTQGSDRPWAYDQRYGQAIALNQQFCGGKGVSS
jgi:hypothetical protein